MADRDYLMELETLAESILDYSNIHNDIIDILDLCKDSVEGLYDIGWTGESKDSFEQAFSKWLSDGNAFCENINQLENALKAMYKNVSELKDEGGNLSNYL